MTYWEGDKYNKDMATVDIAKIIRKEVKKKFPKIEASIRSERFAGGTTINVVIKDPGFNPINPKWRPQDWTGNLITNPRYTERGIRLLKQIDSLCSRFRMSDCDGMTDYFRVNFWLDVKYDYDSEKKWIEKLGIRLAW